MQNNQSAALRFGSVCSGVEAASVALPCTLPEPPFDEALRQRAEMGGQA